MKKIISLLRQRTVHMILNARRIDERSTQPGLIWLAMEDLADLHRHPSGGISPGKDHHERAGSPDCFRRTAK